MNAGGGPTGSVVPGGKGAGRGKTLPSGVEINGCATAVAAEALIHNTWDSGIGATICSQIKSVPLSLFTDKRRPARRVAVSDQSCR